MTHEELRKRPAYITANIQIELYDKVRQYLEEKNISRSDFAKELGVSKGYVTQLLNGDFDHRISKLVELSTKIGYIPSIVFEPTDKRLQDYHDYVAQVIHRLSRTIGCSAFLAQYKDSEEQLSSPEKHTVVPKDIKHNKISAA